MSDRGSYITAPIYCNKCYGNFHPIDTDVSDMASSFSNKVDFGFVRWLNPEKILSDFENLNPKVCECHEIKLTLFIEDRLYFFLYSHDNVEFKEVSYEDLRAKQNP